MVTVSSTAVAAVSSWMPPKLVSSLGLPVTVVAPPTVGTYVAAVTLTSGWLTVVPDAGDSDAGGRVTISS